MYDYLYIPISYLKKLNISQKEFMQNAANAECFLKELLSSISSFVQVKHTFLVYDYFVLILKFKDTIKFENEHIFNLFINYIESTNFKNSINVNVADNEIYVKPDTSCLFYNLLHEFIV